MLSSLVTTHPVRFSFAVALVASIALAPAARAVARRLGIVDDPDDHRKLHARAVPLWGGIAVYLALVAGLLAARFVMPASDSFDQLSTTLMLACGLVCLVGSVDDSHDLNARFKLLLQIASVLPVVLSGYYFDRIVAFGYPIDFGWLGIPLTILWLVGCINALNLLDGLDGLASVVGMSASLTMAIIAGNTGQAHVAVVAVVLAGALAGFLVYNRPPASIFLGDSGSMVIGMVVGMISIQGALKTSATLSITVPAVVMSVPMLDTVFAIVRRKLLGQSFDTADRGHIHHRLLDRGLNDWQALCIIGALCLTTGAAACAATIFRLDALAWTTAGVLVVLLVRTRAFGHYEVALAVERIRRWIGAARRALPGVILGGRTAAVARWDDAWQKLVRGIAAPRAAGFELLLADREGQLRYSWHNGVTFRRSTKPPLIVSIARPDGTFCQFHLLDVGSAAEERDLVAAIASVLDILARERNASGQTLPPADLGVACHRSPGRSWRQAA